MRRDSTGQPEGELARDLGRILLAGSGSAYVLLTFFLIWAELAVGVFGSPFAGR